MRDITNIELHQDHAKVEWLELENLFTLTELGGRKGDKLRRAFLNSHAACYAYDGDRLVGVGRAITDGEYHAVIYDMAVHPEYQRRGVGSLVIRNLLDRLRVWRVMLVASSNVQPFYVRFGFGPYSDVMAKLDWDRLLTRRRVAIRKRWTDRSWTPEPFGRNRCME